MIELERNAPDLEDLAAYLDGRLSAEHKARVEERLARDEDYYEVFLESARFQEEQAAAGEDAEVVAPAAWWRSWATIVPAAIAATLVAAVGLPRLVLGPTTEQWAARLDPASVTGIKDWRLPGWQTNRGDPDPMPGKVDRQRQRELAFRIGSHTIHLRIALAAGDRSAAKRAARQIERRTDEHDFLIGYSTAYEALRNSPEDEEIEALRLRARELEAKLAKSIADVQGADRYALGQWNEVGRLAALAGSAAEGSDRAENEKVLAGIWRRRRVATAIDAIGPDLETLEKALDQTEPDFEAAAGAFSKIARELAGRD